jgi:tetratricopeptide (TPR) repeat protein
MDRDALSVAVGPYLLEVGGEPGTVIEEGGGGADAEPLREALAEREPKTEDERAPALVAEVDEAAEATTKIEQAVALCKGAAEGRVLDPDQLALEVGTLLACLERLDRKKEHKKALQLARSLTTLLMLLKRWASLLQTLRTALRAGKALGDDSAVAWAEHELGTLKLAAGDVEGADRCLSQAREIRERIGDRRGLAATDRNLGALCDRMRSMLRDEHLARPRRGRSPALSLLAVVVAVFAAFGGGLALGSAGGGDDREGTVAETTATQADPDEVSTDDADPDESEVDEVTDEIPVEPPAENPPEKPPGTDEPPPPITESDPPIQEIETPPVVK